MTKETIAAIKNWNNKYDANYEYLQDNFIEQLDYKFHTIHSEEM